MPGPRRTRGGPIDLEPHGGRSSGGEEPRLLLDAEEERLTPGRLPPTAAGFEY